ncbi:MAG: F0F1 ATP synthase subunit B [Chloroflexi bacterium]|nr:F0F1 ATP synthase subunit B [Chloroflexota bacterium]MCL5107661.1 F0F1 ATP synthase subunit B [Chloroflexota bacterium]
MTAIGALGINTVGLVAQIINFLLLMYLLYRFLYRPVVKMLDQRALRVKESMEQAEEVKQQLVRVRDDYAAEMKKARLEAQEVIARAVTEGERLRVVARDEGKREAEAFLSRARAQIERDREEASRALRGEVANLALLAAGQVVSRSFDRSAHHQLIDDVLRDMEQMDLKSVK